MGETGEIGRESNQGIVESSRISFGGLILLFSECFPDAVMCKEKVEGVPE